MNIHCVLNLAEAVTAAADVIVFPEGVSDKNLRAASVHHPDSIIAGAFVDGKHCRGALYRGGVTKLTYLKVCGDGRTLASADLNQLPVYEQGDHLCVGLVVCKDIDHPAFSRRIIEAVKSNRCRYKLLCIPADMGSEWFGSDVLPGGERYHGLHVALFNNNTTYPVVRCQSFVTDLRGRQFRVQRESQPLAATS